MKKTPGKASFFVNVFFGVKFLAEDAVNLFYLDSFLIPQWA